MPGPAHRIGRLSFRLSAPDRAGAEVWMAASEAMAEDRLLPLIGAALDRLAADDRVVLIDRLELDLGALGDDPAALPQALAAALRGALGEAPHSPATPEVLAPPLARWLATGGLPWPDPAATLGVLWQAVAGLSAPEQARLFVHLAPHLAGQAAARRFLADTPSQVVLAMAFAAAGFPAPPPAATMPPPLRSRAARELREAALRAFAAAPTDQVAAAWLAEVLAGDVPPQEVPLFLAEGAEGAEVPTDAAATPAPAAIRADTVDAAAPPARPQAVAQDDPDPAPDPAPALAVPAAGLVLLHPWLPRYLDALGLLAGPGRFADVAARSAAVRAVQRLATGAGIAPEAECALAKVLCGLAPADPLLPEEETAPRLDLRLLQAEGARVLAAVVADWGQLGRTSATGLREGFLCRPGTLTLAAQGPLLRVERRGIDVLLDRLPWTIGLVRTPFMRGLLRVEWKA